MKKFLLFLVITALVGLCIFSIYKKEFTSNEIKERLDESDVYPFYNSLDDDDKSIYVDICAAIENFDYILDFGKFATYRQANNMKEKVIDIYLALVYEQPQYFWVDPYSYYTGISEENGNKLTFKISHIISKDEALDKREIFEKKVSDIVNIASTKNTTYEKVLYTYDKILKTCEYDYNLMNKIDEYNKNLSVFDNEDNESDISSDIAQTAYGCLIDGKTVCSGYALAFNLIMQELGFECGAVKNTALGTFSFGENHVSNYCRLGGDYYYFDLTWDDTSFDSEEYENYLKFDHRFFALTSEEFEKTHLISNDTFFPECNSTKYNYYVCNGMYFNVYNYELAKQSILSQSGKNFATLKFGSYEEALKAQTDLIDEQKIYPIINRNKCKYFIPDYSTHLYIFF